MPYAPMPSSASTAGRWAPQLGEVFPHQLFESGRLNDAQAGPAIQLAHTMEGRAGGPRVFDESTYIGSEGTVTERADLAGLNLAQFPAILVEAR